MNSTEQLRVMQLNCYKLFLCNLEMNYIYKQATEQERNNYYSNPFLRFCMDSVHIQFCLLASSLLAEHEGHSLMNYAIKNKEASNTAKAVYDLLNTSVFQDTWTKVKKLRDKCYAHKDKEVEYILKEVKLSQSERNFITVCLTNSMILLYKEQDNELASFHNQHPKIKSILKVIQEWKSNLQNKHETSQ